MIKLIIFDLDGTLVKTNFKNLRAAREEASKYLEEKYGVKVSPSPPFFLKIYYISKEIAEKHGVDPRKIREKVFRIIERIELEALPYVEEKTRLRDLFTSLKKMGFKVAILTSNSKKYARKVLERFGIADLVDKLVTRDDIERPKPFPDGILKICKELEVDTSQTVMIGDHPVDLEAAKRADVKAIIVSEGDSTKLMSKEAAAIIHDISFDEIMRVIKKIDC